MLVLMLSGQTCAVCICDAYSYLVVNHVVLASGHIVDEVHSCRVFWFCRLNPMNCVWESGFTAGSCGTRSYHASSVVSAM